MEDNWLWHLSGSMDTALRIAVEFNKDERYKNGYEVKPALTYSRPNEVESIFGMLDEYCEDQGVQYRIEDLESTNRMVIENPKNIRRFLEPLIGGFVQQRERAELMLTEFLPLVEEGRPTNKEVFMEVVEVADKLREMSITGHTSKYDKEYFEEEWQEELLE